MSPSIPKGRDQRPSKQQKEHRPREAADSISTRRLSAAPVVSIAPGAVLAGSQGPCRFLGGKKHGRKVYAQLGEIGPVQPLASDRKPARFRLAQLPSDAILAAENRCGTPGTLGDGAGRDGITGSKIPHRASARFLSVAVTPVLSARSPPARTRRPTAKSCASDRRPPGSRRRSRLDGAAL